jgi:hypothetical protein
MTARCVDPEIGGLLAAYELGLADASERLAFEAHLAACDVCADDAFASADAAAVATGDAARVVRGLAVGPGLLARLLRPFRDLARRPHVLVPALTTAGAVGLLVLWRLGAPDPASLAIVEPAPYVPLAVRDAGAGDATALFHRGMERYAGGDWAAAATDLRGALAAAAPPLPPARRDQANVFLGVSLLLEGDVDAAVAPLEAGARSELPVLADRARWYLAQAKLRAGDADAARTLLESLDGSPGYAAEAAEQLRRLRAARR